MVLKASATQHHHSKIDIFESAFRKIKEATGVSDVNEVIAKIFSQEGTTENLIVVSKEHQARVTQLLRDIATKRVKVEQLKYNGLGTMQRRKLVDELEQNQTLSSTRLDRSRRKFERLTKMLLEIKSGIHHLADKLEATLSTPTRQRSDDTVRLLQDVQDMCRHVVAQVVPEKTKTHHADLVQHIDDVDAMNSRPYNQRIPLPGEEWHEDDETLVGTLSKKQGGGYFDEMDDALSRDKVKKASTQILLAQEKKKHRGMKSGGVVETAAALSPQKHKSNSRLVKKRV